MVQDLKYVRQASLFSETVSTTDSACVTTHVSCDSQSELAQSVRLQNKLNQKVRLIQKYAHLLSCIDERTESITRALKHYSNGVGFESLGLGGSSFRVSDSDRRINLNLEVATCIAQKVEEMWVNLALLVFLCHEASHISQGLGEYRDVQRIKEVDQEFGRQRMAEIDLRSDFLAVHTLSLVHTLHNNRGKNKRKDYEHWFYIICHKVCRPMLDIFPSGERKDKQQRVFGHLLMSNLIRDTYLSRRPLEFGDELWPVWSESLDRLSIYSDSRPLIAGAGIDPVIMKQILDCIADGQYDTASAGIEEIWRYLPRR